MISHSRIALVKQRHTQSMEGFHVRARFRLVECLVCGSGEVELLHRLTMLYRCLECGEHFEDGDLSPSATKESRRKSKTNKYAEDEEW